MGTGESGQGRLWAEWLVDCSRCNACVQLPGVTAKDAVKVARKRGWHHTRDAGWFCPSCAALVFAARGAVKREQQQQRQPTKQTA